MKSLKLARRIRNQAPKGPCPVSSIGSNKLPAQKNSLLTYKDITNPEACQLLERHIKFTSQMEASTQAHCLGVPEMPGGPSIVSMLESLQRKIKSNKGTKYLVLSIKWKASNQLMLPCEGYEELASTIDIGSHNSVQKLNKLNHIKAFYLHF